MIPTLVFTGEFAVRNSSDEEGWVYDVSIADRTLPGDQVIMVVGFCANQTEGAVFWQQPNRYDLFSHYNFQYLKAHARNYALNAGVHWGGASST